MYYIYIYIAWYMVSHQLAPYLTLRHPPYPFISWPPNGGKPHVGKASLRRETSGGDTT